MNSKRYVLAAIAALLILTIVMPTSTMAVTPTVGPKLVVTTVAEDDQKRETGMIVLGLSARGGQDCPFGAGAQDYTPVTPSGWPLPFQRGCDFLSQHKLSVSFNGQPFIWRINLNDNGKPLDPSPLITCAVFEKDKVQPVDEKTGEFKGQFEQENVLTKLVDVSSSFICKPRWKQLSPGIFESSGVLDVYYIGRQDPHFIADNILVVGAAVTFDNNVTVFGVDIQDICVLGFSMGDNVLTITKPEKDWHWTWDDPLGPFVSCEEAALWQRDFLGVPIVGLAV